MPKFRATLGYANDKLKFDGPCVRGESKAGKLTGWKQSGVKKKNPAPQECAGFKQ